MSKLTKQIKEYVKCPQLDGGADYGEWGALRLDQRRVIKELCEEAEIFENTSDDFKQQLAEKDEHIQTLNSRIKEYDRDNQRLRKIMSKDGLEKLLEIKIKLDEKDKEIARLKKEIENEVADSFDMEGKWREAEDKLEEKGKEIEDLKAKLEKCCNSQWYIDMDRLKANEAIQKLLKDLRRQVCEEIKKEIQNYLRKSGLLKLELVFGINFIIDQIEKGGTDDNQ